MKFRWRIYDENKDEIFPSEFIKNHQKPGYIQECRKNFCFYRGIGDGDYHSHYVYFLALNNDNQVVGVIKLLRNDRDDSSFPGFKNWVTYIDTHKDYRRLGISTKLKKMLFRYCKENGLNLLSGSFTAMGYTYNLPQYIRYAKEYNIEYGYNDLIDHTRYDTMEGMFHSRDEYIAYVDSINSDKPFGGQYKIINERE